MEEKDTQTVTEKNDEKEFEREKNGLIREVVEERKKRRALEERIAAIESSLNAPDPEPPTSADVRVQKFAQDPDSYIKEVVSPLIRNEVDPLRKSYTSGEIERKLDKAMEWIAEEEGISRRQASKKYEQALSKIVEDNGFGNLDPYDGTLTAYKILKTDEKESEEKEKERNKTIEGKLTETSRPSNSPSPTKWTTSKISRLTRVEFEKHRDEILDAQRKGLIVRDT